MIQADDFNRSRIRTVNAVTLSINLRLEAAPGNLLLTTGETGLPNDFGANVSQIVTLDKSFLTEQAGSLEARLMMKIEDGIRLVLTL